MDVTEAIRRRRMTRSFESRPIDSEVLDEILMTSLLAPSAGNSRGTSWISLLGELETARYFEAATDESWRRSAPRAPGLLRAGAVALLVADPAAYVERYSAPDKVGSGLGRSIEAWPVPYWWGDAGGVVMAALLLAEEAGLGACIHGAFRNVDAIKSSLGIPEPMLVYGALLLGHPAGDDRRSASLDRPGPSRAERIHHAGW